MSMLESLSEDEVHVEENPPEIPAPVTAKEESSGADRYDDEDVELL